MYITSTFRGVIDLNSFNENVTSSAVVLQNPNSTRENAGISSKKKRRVEEIEKPTLLFFYLLRGLSKVTENDAKNVLGGTSVGGDHICESAIAQRCYSATRFFCYSAEGRCCCAVLPYHQTKEGTTDTAGQRFLVCLDVSVDVK